MNKAKVAYRPVGAVLGVVGGVMAGAVFKQIWKVLGHEDSAPKAGDEDRTWREVLLAATLEGALFAAVRAAVNRAGAVGVRRLTGTWPG